MPTGQGALGHSLACRVTGSLRGGALAWHRLRAIVQLAPAWLAVKILTASQRNGPDIWVKEVMKESDKDWRKSAEGRLS